VHLGNFVEQNVEFIPAWLLLAQVEYDEPPPASEARPLGIDSEDLPTDAAGAWDIVVESLLGMWADLLARLPLIVAGIIVLLITWGLTRVIDRTIRFSLRRTHLRRSLRELLRQLVYITVWVVGLLTAAVVVFPGMTPAKVLTVLGLSSIAVGFAFKDIVENFFAGALILWRFPFEHGDFIECDGILGKVEETTIRMTTLRQVDGQLVVMPNGQLLKTPVFVLTSQPKRRITIIVGVDYTTDLDRAQQVLREATQQCSTVDKAHDVEIFGQEYASSSINFEVTWWTGSTPLEFRASRDEVVRAIKRGLDAADISIPFPHRTLTFKESLTLQQRSDGEEPGGG
jgi:small conductance mechanosensitive channel